MSEKIEITYTHRGWFECFPVYLQPEEGGYSECTISWLNWLMELIVPPIQQSRSWVAAMLGIHDESAHCWMFTHVRRLDKPVKRIVRAPIDD